MSFIKNFISLLVKSVIISSLIVALFTFPLERVNHQIYISLIMTGIISIYYSPTQVSILKNLAIESSITGNNKMAISYLEQALEVFPHYEAGLINLSKVYYLEKEYAKSYITLLQCNQYKTTPDYKGFMEKLKKRIDVVGD